MSSDLRLKEASFLNIVESLRGVRSFDCTWAPNLDGVYINWICPHTADGVISISQGVIYYNSFPLVALLMFHNGFVCRTLEQMLTY